MNINLEIIINVCLGMLICNFILASIGKVLLRYFLDNSDTVQKEKKKFQEKLKDKVNESNGTKS
jgi:hypothetical protein